MSDSPLEVLDSSSNGETVLVPCAGERCSLCTEFSLHDGFKRIRTRIAARKRGTPPPPLPRSPRLEGAHLVELRELLLPPRGLLARRPELEIHPYLDGYPIHPRILSLPRKHDEEPRVVFTGRDARVRAHQAVEALRLAQARLAAQSAADHSAAARFQALATALSELDPPHR